MAAQESSSSPQETTPATSPPPVEAPTLLTADAITTPPAKVVIRFRAIGNAPILKRNFFKITATNRFQLVIQFLRRELKYKPSDPLFVYINSAFSPAPDEIIENLYRCFKTDGQLIVNYCTTAAWG
ncbi:Ubiquitin-like protein [Dispira simplex]|nr:Ubiquitin-like protein [Dispira simplex]